ncbi:hypothetical protein GGU11DRAFT_516833 [Lentinula aff. detonsa]|nr:hypothetical protein GGU11DRAFT_516833 [Lentinula aff. detonsa]
MKTLRKSENNRRVFISSPFSNGTRIRALARLSRLSSTSYFRICAFVSLFLIISSTGLLFATLTAQNNLFSLLPLPHRLRKSWAVNGALKVGEGPLIPRLRHSNFSMSADMLQSNESIYVISLPHRADRRIRMESLRKYLSLNWTFIDATYADEEIVATIMSNVYTLREEAMRARLELQRIRDEKLKEKEKEDDSDLFALVDYPDDLELHSTSTSHLPLSTPISPPYQSSQSNRKFTGVKLPFQWPVTSSFTNQSVLLESPQELSIFASSISHPSLKTRILEFFKTFDIYAKHSDGTHRTWRTESDIPNLVDDNNDHEYFSHFLTNLETHSSPKSSISKTNDFDRSSLTQLELICATKDFSLSPYSSTLPYHKYLTSARVAVWHSHLKVLRQIVQEEDLRRKNERELVESPGEGKGIASTTLANPREKENVIQIEGRARTGVRWIRHAATARCNPIMISIPVLIESPIDERSTNNLIQRTIYTTAHLLILNLAKNTLLVNLP